MDNSTVTRINIAMQNGKPFGVPIVEGNVDEVLMMSISLILAVLEEAPENRRAFRRAALQMLRETRPEWQKRLLKTIFGAIGIGLLVFLVGNGVVFLASALGIW